VLAGGLAPTLLTTAYPGRLAPTEKSRLPMRFARGNQARQQSKWLPPPSTRQNPISGQHEPRNPHAA
jgi:hypothetical protein